MNDNIAGIAGRILRAPERLNSLYGRKDLYRAYADIERRSGVSDSVILIFHAAAIDREGHGDEQPAELLTVGTAVLFTGAAQTMRNTDSGQFDTFIMCDYIRTGYAEPQNEIRITGTIERKPTHRATPAGKKITDIVIRVPSHFESSFYCLIPVITWNKTAEAAAELEAGDTVEISGRLQSREYTKRYEDGREEQRTTTEISAYHFIKKV